MSTNPTIKKEEALKYVKAYDAKKASSFAKTTKDTGFGSKFKIMLEMLKDKEFTLSDHTKLIFMGALGYVILPIDMVPDFVPIAGWIDDAAVLGAVWSAAKGDVQKFLFQKKGA